jgi:hypothetical protein
LAVTVAISGDYAYVADEASGLQVIDISDPTSPVSAGSYDTPGNTHGVAVSGGYAYAAADTSGLQVIAIADAVPPTLAGGYNTPGAAYAVTVSGDYAYVADMGSGLQVIDIGDPTNLTSAGSYDTPGVARGVAVSGDYVYVADDSSGLRVIDISDPTSPTSAGSYDTPGTARGVAVSGDYAYVADMDYGLRVIDISDPTSPADSGSIATLGSAHEVVISGDYAYVAVHTSGLQVIDISDPTDPTSAGSYDPGGYALDLTVSGDYAYVAAYTGDLQVIDISDPTNPTSAASFTTLDRAFEVAISGDYAYIADEDYLTVVDISDPTSPVTAGSYNTPSYAYGVAVSGDHAYVACYNSGLRVIEVSQRSLNLQANTARSLAIDQGDDDVVGARLTTTQSDSILWELSADSGSSWQAFPPGGAYEALTAPGSDLVWRSTHVYAGGGINPTCTDLEIEWLYGFPVIASTTDIPNDQGKQVSLSWVKSGNDYVGSPTPITEYAVYRKIDEDLSMSSARGRRERFSAAGRRAGDGEDREGFYPPGQWHFIVTVPASAEDEYAVVVPTLADSTISEGMYYTTFFVRALTGTPGVHFDAYPDSGYSIDNLAPVAPLNLTMPSATDLAWDECPEDDFNYFTAYGSTSPDLDSTATLIGYTAGTLMDVTGDAYAHYHVTATDSSGNESDASSVVNAYAGMKDVKALPTVYGLKQNRPNPFSGETAVRFDLPEPCVVTLKVIDVEGRLVRALTDGSWAAGRHRLTWAGEDEEGTPVGPGIYFIRIETGNFRATKKMLLMR